MKKVLSMFLVLVIVTTMSVSLTGCGDPEKKAAKEAFKAEAEKINELVTERTTEIAKAKELLTSKEKALDDTIQPALEDACTVENEEIEIPKMPSETAEITAKTETLKWITSELVAEIDDIKNMEDALTKSRKQYKMLVMPEESFVIERLKNVADIDKIEAVTEDNDPNGHLGKQGGYTAQIFFSSPLVSSHTGNVIEDGTSGGGSIEIYKTASEANKRSEYLASYDGSIFASGSHTVYGTILVRTSDELTASQQKQLETDIVNALTAI